MGSPLRLLYSALAIPPALLPMSKRALIVDDSRSARVILTRMLEGYGLGVDASESAEQALEHLKQSRPDVIFMDHLMPGMDGFQAIAAIKGNPETSMIPVVMYTSQEGELYLSQARALGAVGVLPKTVKQSDVSRVLYQLRLLPERREARPQLIAQAGGHDAAGVQVEPPPKPTVGEIETAIRAAMAPVLKEHAAELRRFMVASLDAFARRIGGEGKQESAAAPAPEAAPAAEPPPEQPHRWPLAAAVAALALLPTLILGVLYTRTLQTTQSLMQSNARLASVVEEQQAQMAAIQQSLQSQTAPVLTAAARADAEKESELVPYGEAPLSGARLERLRAILDGLKASGFRGRLKVATYVGEFCLTGNGIEGYSMAADDLPARRCDLRGNPFDDSLSAAQRQSLAFANLISSVRQDLGEALTIDVTHVGRRPTTPYPNSEQLTAVTAGEWNKIAAQNNRVEFAAEPAGS
jgi:CheY-like chemotaxis protein